MKFEANKLKWTREPLSCSITEDKIEIENENKAEDVSGSPPKEELKDKEI